MAPRLVAVVGRSGTGKTTTMEFLIRELSRSGLKVAAVKRIHDPGFSIDTPGKDTHRLAEAGARVVVSAADKEIAVIKRARPSEDYHLPEIIRKMKSEDIDVVLLEGFHSVVAHNRSVPKILTAANEGDLKEARSMAGGPIIAITGIIANNNEVAPSLGGAQVLSLKRDGPRLLSVVLDALRPPLSASSRISPRTKIRI